MDNIGIKSEEKEIYIKIIKKVPDRYKNIAQEFIIKKIDEGKRTETIKGYFNDLIQFIRYLEIKGVDLFNIDSKEIELFKGKMLRRGLKPKSINRKLTSINQFLKSIDSQVKFRKIKEQSQNFLNDVFTREEIERLIKCCSNIRDKAIISTLWKTGIRVSELLQLKVRDVGKESIDIEGKGGKHRDILISNELNKLLKEYLKVRISVPGNELFTGKRGALKRGAINKIILKYAKLAKIRKEKAHPHSFRHAFCKALADNGVSIDIIADLAGHKSLDTTRIYTRHTKKELIKILDNI
ncbi:integrase (plasmid) [Clostridium carboxidivorans P7]|uniref:Integrase family protein n=1 Tax=Clostridium carboxidivorans P7 TaxID=536227 RepID=C6PZX9_9CLOT|nr:tyrosine-type recombinase/integrase [Clostridium carboxidivorans]ADO12131.1 putative integrase/recombinase [Clostridium carboxidivorans P7]AKN34266.1 integrase [Clostridium carboxidivorans P7]EET85189.1 integrase family protein [Clostridium carboxidivorans P7]EFG87535.1 phage integrase [Clostridium carboxidivorans P7]